MSETPLHFRTISEIAVNQQPLGTKVGIRRSLLQRRERKRTCPKHHCTSERLVRLRSTNNPWEPKSGFGDPSYREEKGKEHVRNTIALQND
jgi:hypothetical protein